MASKNYGYQYETSPRKIEPEYKTKTTNKKKTNNGKKNNKKVVQKKKNNIKNRKKFKMSFEFKFCINSLLIFSLLFSVIALQASVEQKYKEKEGLKQKYSELLASKNLLGNSEEDVRIMASQYGMQTKSATLVDLGTSDYIESSVDKVEIDNNSNVLDAIVNFFKNIF